MPKSNLERAFENARHTLDEIDNGPGTVRTYVHERNGHIRVGVTRRDESGAFSIPRHVQPTEESESS